MLGLHRAKKELRIKFLKTDRLRDLSIYLALKSISIRVKFDILIKMC